MKSILALSILTFAGSLHAADAALTAASAPTPSNFFKIRRMNFWR
jgi:hypothetical protein